MLPVVSSSNAEPYRYETALLTHSKNLVTTGFVTSRAVDWRAVASLLAALRGTAMSQLVNAPWLFLSNEHW